MFPCQDTHKEMCFIPSSLRVTLGKESFPTFALLWPTLEIEGYLGKAVRFLTQSLRNGFRLPWSWHSFLHSSLSKYLPNTAYVPESIVGCIQLWGKQAWALVSRSGQSPKRCSLAPSCGLSPGAVAWAAELVTGLLQCWVIWPQGTCLHTCHTACSESQLSKYFLFFQLQFTVNIILY